MPRQKNIKPTLIYWLVDVRPETIGAGWPNGKPFYCGKTVSAPELRLKQHRRQAKNKPHGRVGTHVTAYGEFIRIDTMEVVPLEKDWCIREKFWISQVRLMNPDCANVSDGGTGAPGNIVPSKIRAKISATLRGKKKSPEHAAKVAATRIGKKLSIETREKMRLAKAGKTLTPEHRAKIAQGNRGKTNSPESRAKLSLALRGKKKSSEHCEKLRLAFLGRKLSPETIAKRTATLAQNRQQRV